MACLECETSLPSTALSSGTAKTCIRLKAPANQRVAVLRYGFFFDGTSNTAQPVQIQIGRISADGTLTAATPLPVRQGLPETPQTSVEIQASVEPTYSGYLRTITVHPQTGYDSIEDQQDPIEIEGGGMLGFVVNAPAAVDIRGFVRHVE